MKISAAATFQVQDPDHLDLVATDWRAGCRSRALAVILRDLGERGLTRQLIARITREGIEEETSGARYILDRDTPAEIVLATVFCEISELEPGSWQYRLTVESEHLHSTDPFFYL